MSKQLKGIVIKRTEKVTKNLVDLFEILNTDMNCNSPLRVKFGEDCFHDLADMTDAFIAYHDFEPIGCAILKKQSKEIGIMTNIYTAPDFRKHGLFYKLLEAVEKRAKERGHLMLIGDTWKELIPMQRAWLKGGFTEYKVMPDNKVEKDYYEAGHNYWKLLATPATNQ